MPLADWLIIDGIFILIGIPVGLFLGSLIFTIRFLLKTLYQQHFHPNATPGAWTHFFLTLLTLWVFYTLLRFDRTLGFSAFISFLFCPAILRYLLQKPHWTRRHRKRDRLIPWQKPPTMSLKSSAYTDVPYPLADRVPFRDS